MYNVHCSKTWKISIFLFKQKFVGSNEQTMKSQQMTNKKIGFWNKIKPQRFKYCIFHFLLSSVWFCIHVSRSWHCSPPGTISSCSQGIKLGCNYFLYPGMEIWDRGEMITVWSEQQQLAQSALYNEVDWLEQGWYQGISELWTSSDTELKFQIIDDQSQILSLRNLLCRKMNSHFRSTAALA